MSYQVLARKWRPKNFSQLVGQQHVVTVLVNALMQERLHHAYLFTGTRGVGKTTIARIFAKSLNCQEGITAEPCGKCDVCLDVDQGNFVDLLEIDAASRTKVDDTREILDNVQYAPTRGRFKVYLIDEVHMLSKSSFNALLKTLEEPPPHVKFILATTDPQKLPVTVLSRCLQFHLKALTPAQIEQKLSEILAAEQVTFEPGALTILAKAARGSMRDSLSLTDQAIAQGQGNITASNLQSMLGGVDQNWIYKILIALVKQDAQGLLALTQSIASFAPSYHRLLAELLQLLHQVALWQLLPNSVDVDKQRATLLTKFAKSMSPEDVQLYYQIVLNGRKDLPYSFDEQAGFDMVILRLLAFKPKVAADISAEPQQVSDATESFDDVELNVPVAEQEAAKQDTAKSELQSSPLKPKPLEAQPIEALPIDTKPSEPKQAEPQTPEQVHSPKETSSAESTVSPKAPASPGMFQRPEPATDINSLNAEQQELEQLAQQQFAPIDSYSQDDMVPMSEEDEQGYTPVEPMRPAEQPVQAPTNSPAARVPEQASPEPDSATGGDNTLEKLLATRNMLRSRKKLAEGSGKKPSIEVAKAAKVEQVDSPLSKAKQNVEQVQAHSAQPVEPAAANTEPANTVQAEGNVEQNETAPALLPELEHTNLDDIDPSIVYSANQVDAWAQLIDAMELGGRVRQLAYNATMDAQSNDQYLKINLHQNTAHINSPQALEQIKSRYSAVKNTAAEVEIHVVENPGLTPLVIQQIINEKRQANAQQIIHHDKFVQHLANKFDASVIEESIEPL